MESTNTNGKTEDEAPSPAAAENPLLQPEMHYGSQFDVPVTVSDDDEDIVPPSPDRSVKSHRSQLSVSPQEAPVPSLPAARPEPSLYPVRLNESDLTRELELSPQRFALENTPCPRPSPRLCTKIDFDLPFNTQTSTQPTETKTQTEVKLTHPLILSVSPEPTRENEPKTARQLTVTEDHASTPTSWRTRGILNQASVAVPEKVHDVITQEKQPGHTSTPNQSLVDQLHLTDSDIAQLASNEATPTSQGLTEPVADIDESKYWKLTVECNFGPEVSSKRIVRILPKMSGLFHYLYERGEKKFVEDIPTDIAVPISAFCFFNTSSNSEGYLADVSATSKHTSRLSRTSVASSVEAGMFAQSSRLSIASGASVDFPKPSHPVRPRVGPKATSSPEVVILEDNPEPERSEAPVELAVTEKAEGEEKGVAYEEKGITSPGKADQAFTAAEIEESLTHIIPKDTPHTRKRGKRARPLSSHSEATANSDDEFVPDKRNRPGASKLKLHTKRTKTSPRAIENEPVTIPEAGTSLVPLPVVLEDVKNGEEGQSGLAESSEDLVKQAEEQWRQLRTTILADGMAVYARWPNGYYYPAALQSKEADGRWLVEFADGSHRKILEHQILPIGLLRVGQAVCVDADDTQTEESLCRPGCVIGYQRRVKKIAYLVDLEGREGVVYNRERVFFTSEQAKEMEAMNAIKAVFTPRGAQVSLDNIVEGKRRRVPSSPVPPASANSPRSTPRIAVSCRRVRKRGKNDTLLDTSTMSESSESLLANLEATLRHRIVARVTGQVEEEEPMEQEVQDNTVDVAVLGPLPTTPLFAEYAFLLTRSTKALPTQDQEEEFEEIPYLKMYVSQQLSQGGGLVLERFDYAQISSRAVTLLIANKPCRTERYVRCLAVGIRAVSHEWVVHCCQQGKVLPWQSYALAAGYALDGSILSWDHRGNSCVFKGMRVLVTSQNAGFVALWQPLLLDAQASAVKRLPARKKSQEVEGALCVDVVVTDGACPPGILRAAGEMEIPVVSSEWVIQCLIAGKRLAFKDSPQFAHNYGAVASS